MGANTKIEWADHSVNLWWGCTKVAQGCKHCYAETWAKRVGRDIWGDDNPREYIKSSFDTLDRLQRGAAKYNEKHTVFVGSMMDIFEPNRKAMPVFLDTDSIRKALFCRIRDGEYPNLVFQFLTKRPAFIYTNLRKVWKDGYLPTNMWFGASASTQDEFDATIGSLTIARVNLNFMTPPPFFLSLEPLIEEINIDVKLSGLIRWIIVGGESGGDARRMDPAWVEKIIKYCNSAGIPVFVKQMGSAWAKETNSHRLSGKGDNWHIWPHKLRIRQDMPYDNRIGVG